MSTMFMHEAGNRAVRQRRIPHLRPLGRMDAQKGGAGWVGSNYAQAKTTTSNGRPLAVQRKLRVVQYAAPLKVKYYSQRRLRFLSGRLKERRRYVGGGGKEFSFRSGSGSNQARDGTRIACIDLVREAAVISLALPHQMVAYLRFRYYLWWLSRAGCKIGVRI
ncbi:hypothetical protein CPC08DRAFT_755856 [Agrocybe pediades]|nr:hypothetical protein CPC08DRAFT_755856 [Agrocybe pediades]